MVIKTHKYFNQSTREALFDHVNGYVNKTKSVNAEIETLINEYKIKKIYRFDLGENVDGFSPNVKKFIENKFNENVIDNLNEYPDITHRNLRKQIGDYYNIKREKIVVSAGLDSVLDLITRVFLEKNDSYLMTIPDFFLFENYSERMGAIPLFLPKEEIDNFGFSPNLVSRFADMIGRFRPKLVMISNPSNPSGYVMKNEILHEIIKICHHYNVFIVIDEAYSEYIENHYSAINYIHNYQNLMVLKTFSKAYGLAGIRVGYLVCSSAEIIKALLLHRHHFPATQLSLDIAAEALRHQEFIFETRKNNEIRKAFLFKELKKLNNFHFIPSATNIFMLKHKYLTDDELDILFKKKGIIASSLKITGIEGKNYLRITVKKDEENQFLLDNCKKIDEKITSAGYDGYRNVLSFS